MLSWAASTASDFSNYTVIMESANDSVLVVSTDRNWTQYEVQGLQPENTYRFRVDLETTADRTGKGNMVTVTTKSGIFPPSTSPDLLMEHFKKSWEQKTITGYEKLLTGDFQFFFDPADNLDDFVGGPSWARTKELAAATNLFSSQPGFDPVKRGAIPPILSIEFTTFSKITNWEAPPDGILYAGTMRARFKVSIRVTYQGYAGSTQVSGDNDFYVINVNPEGPVPLYEIKVWEDKGQYNGKRLKSERTSWGMVKVWFQ